MLAIGRWQIPCLQEIADQVRNDAMGERLPKAKGQKRIYHLALTSLNLRFPHSALILNRINLMVSP